MFLPVKYQSSQQTLVNRELTVCPVNHLDVNSAGMVDGSKTVNISDQDGQYKQSIFLKISRTPLSNDDPNTYIAFPPDFQPNKSKIFAEYDFQLNEGNDEKKSSDWKNNSSLSSSAGKPSGASRSPDYNTFQSSSEANSSAATDKKPFGASLNAFTPDPFKFVHLTPGCDNHYVNLHIPNKDSTNFYSDRLYVDNSNLKSPKTAITRNSSAFLSKAIPAEGMHKKLCNSDSVIYNCHGKVFNIYSLKYKNFRATNNKAEEIIDSNPLLRMVFTKTISCMDSIITGTSKSQLKFDMLIGFISGDILWYDPFLNKYSRFNKNGKLLKNSPVISLKWLHDGKHFLAGFSDGSLLLFNRNLEEDENHFSNCMQNARNNSNPQQKKKFLRVLKSIETANVNPIGHYKMSASPVTSIIQFPITNSLLFELLRNTLCITFDDGFARIFDLGNEVVSTVLPSSFSGIFCSCWSPDGKYLVLAGQDDLINMFEISPYLPGIHNANGITSPASSITTGASPRSITYGTISSSASISSFDSGNSNRHLLTSTANNNSCSLLIKLVARLQGHYSWIRSVKFDYLKCPPKFIASPVNYRISSVGDDGKLIFWDFLPKTISKSKLKQLHNSGTGYNSNMANTNTGKSQQVRNRNRRNTKNSMNSNASIIGMTTNNQQDQPTKKLEQALQVTKGVPVTDGYNSKTSSADGEGENGIPNTTTSETSITKNAIIHDLLSNKKVGIIQPLASIDLNFGRLANVQYINDGIWVTAAGGDIRKFKRPA